MCDKVRSFKKRRDAQGGVQHSEQGKKVHRARLERQDSIYTVPGCGEKCGFSTCEWKNFNKVIEFKF